MTHLFLFTITPVQSFISQARKTQDLWAGSRMLSDFIRKVYLAIKDEGGTVIFPSKNSESMPNRILASFNFNKTDQELKDLGKKIANEVAVELQRLTKKAAEKIGTTEYAKIKDAFEAQLKDYFSSFWVFVPVKNDNYAAAYDNADRLLGAVKNSRIFTQYPEQGRKCSLSGEQNALVFYKSDVLPAYTYAISQDGKTIIPLVAQFDNPNINEGEGLSAITFIKRFYPFRSDRERKEFDSTADIALLHTLTELKKIQDQQGQNLFLNEFAYCVSENQTQNIDEVDGQLFFEENFTKKYFEKHNINIGFLEVAKSKLKNIYKKAKENNLYFTKYYAILLFDADSMGAWLSGEYLIEREIKLHDFHTHLSDLLSGFARYASNYVDGSGTDKTKKGRTVYAGGDDYLGFVNLHYLFEVIKHLREQFKAQVSDKISDGRFQIKENKEMTFSAGIAIAHYKTPLSEVLNWARKMEEEAKDTENKDSFGIAVLKKSGEIHKVVLPFKTIKNSEDVWYTELLQEVREGLDALFSSNFITVLQRETMLLDGEIDSTIIQILNHEIERLVLRAKNKATKEEALEMAKKVKQVYEPNKRNIKNFNASLSICDFINRKLQGND
ncbi:MAG: type III-B CRISPR-associated protein Cas10/Cmr2 [Thermaurantimonas sp.]|uniref:type III-B CRISPR-associated protein Cas10/Cmr2 n=1 Tax=Thermaurantimonas sp. TaxID=2681568 RepID=UPI00391B95FE